ncbi:HugZ family protein [Chelatococcus sp. GCM10030263]|uniref:HugZ family pyridoxamine 5'-phosphate oxidase n=1 Tax=Chelatococcus sp. GCM10030263 TaxID=3273387 RepID=UPI00360A0D57
MTADPNSQSLNPPDATQEEPAPASAPFDPSGTAKDLIRLTRYGSLGTLDTDGAPYASLVNVATDVDGRPILLVSQLALHTRNILRDARVSLLLAHVGEGDPSAHPRVTIKGRAVATTDPRIRQRFLARHPGSAAYADFGDFGFYRIDPERAHLVAGFGRIHDLDPSQILTDVTGAESLLAAEASAVEHMNEDHGEALALYAVRLLGEEPGPWRTTGLDPDGIDLMAGDRTARLAFPQRVTEGAGLRLTLKLLADRARQKSAGEAGAA